MQIAVAIVGLLIIGAIVGSLINFGSTLLGIPLALIFIGMVVGKEGFDRQRRILQMKRFRREAMAQQVDFTPEDKRTLVLEGEPGEGSEADPHRLLRVELPELARRRVLPEGLPAKSLARALLARLRHRRGQLDLLPAGVAEGGRALDRADAAPLRLRPEGEPLPHPHQSARRPRPGHRALLRTDRAAHEGPREARPDRLAAAAQLPARRGPARVSTGGAAGGTPLL